MIRVLRIIILLSFTNAILACSKSDSSESKSVVSKIEVFGDPHELLAGSTMNETSYLTVSNKSTSSATMKSFDIFVETMPKELLLSDDEIGVDPSAASRMATSEPVNPNEPEVEPVFEMVGPYGPSTDPYYIYHSPDFGLAYKFKEIGSRLVLFSILEPGDNNTVIEYPATALHYSQSTDGRFFSILISTRVSEFKRMLISAHFSKDSATATDVTDSILGTVYKYLFGDQDLVGWDPSKTLTLSLCGDGSAKYRTQIEQAIAAWSTELTNRLTINVETKTNYPPFSDVNSQCIYTADKYSMKLSENGAVLGLTLVSEGEVPSGAGNTIRRIRAGNIILFGANIKSSVADHPLRNELLIVKSVAMHEIGHLLGLGHKFDGTRSIMSYEYELSLQNYDKNAVSLLYPTRR